MHLERVAFCPKLRSPGPEGRASARRWCMRAVQLSDWLGQFTSVSPHADPSKWAMALSLSGQLLWPHVNLSPVTLAYRPSSLLLLFTTFVLTEDSNRALQARRWCADVSTWDRWRLRGKKAEGWSKKSKSRARNLRRGNRRTPEWAREPTQMKAVTHQ